MRSKKVKNIISKKIRIRHPEHFRVGENSIVDDFSYFSAKVNIGNFCHIASGCSIAGGVNFECSIGDYTSISSGVKIWCRSNDFVNDLVILGAGKVEVGDKKIEGNVKIGAMSGIGANSVIMPNNSIPEGTVIGALSFVPANFKFKPWGVYAGIPIRFIKKRNKKNVLRQLAKLKTK